MFSDDQCSLKRGSPDLLNFSSGKKIQEKKKRNQSSITHTSKGSRCCHDSATSPYLADHKTPARPSACQANPFPVRCPSGVLRYHSTCGDAIILEFSCGRE
jgi:hypothetical protein